MKITDTRVKVLDTDNKVKAIASITFDGCFVIHEIKVVEGINGLFVIMPGKKAADGTFKDIAHPLNTETRNTIQETVLAAYETAKNEL